MTLISKNTSSLMAVYGLLGLLTQIQPCGPGNDLVTHWHTLPGVPEYLFGVHMQCRPYIRSLQKCRDIFKFRFDLELRFDFVMVCF